MSDTKIIMTLAFFSVFSLALSAAALATFPNNEMAIMTNDDMLLLGSEFIGVAIACVVTTGIPCAAALGAVGLVNYLYATTPSTEPTNVWTGTKEAPINKFAREAKPATNYLLAAMIYKMSNGTIDIIHNTTIATQMNLTYSVEDTTQTVPTNKRGSILFLLLTPFTIVIAFMLARMARGVPST